MLSASKSVCNLRCCTRVAESFFEVRSILHSNYIALDRSLRTLSATRRLMKFCNFNTHLSRQKKINFAKLPADTKAVYDTFMRPVAPNVGARYRSLLKGLRLRTSCQGRHPRQPVAYVRTPTHSKPLKPLSLLAYTLAFQVSNNKRCHPNVVISSLHIRAACAQLPFFYKNFIPKNCTFWV